MGQKVTIIQLMSRVSHHKKGTATAVPFFIPKRGFCTAKAVPLLKRQDAAGKAVVLGRFFVAGDSNYN